MEARFAFELLQNGMVPKFFVGIHKMKTGVDPVAAYIIEDRKYSWTAPLASLSFIGVAASFIVICLAARPGGINYVQIIVGILLTSVCACVFMKIMNRPPLWDGPGHKFFASVSDLFTAFGVTPSKEVGALSFEEFRANVEEILKAKAGEVDDVVGFDKINIRKGFNSLHSKALEWDLCHKDHARYFPVKTPAKK